uniref:Uncharacterized protein n=1 Tax=viral metagenome TaxID=1070528 RepID=A0A6C0DUM6_9ZZZZ
MTSIVQDIQVVRSLRKDLTVGTDPKLPPNILKSIDIIHNCIKSGTDFNGWKKVDWRNGGGGARGSGPAQQRSGPNSGHGQGYNRGGNGFFGGRQSSYGNDRNDRYEQSSSSHYAFGGRSRGGFAGRQTPEPPQSIPLTAGTAGGAVAVAVAVAVAGAGGAAAGAGAGTVISNTVHMPSVPSVPSVASVPSQVSADGFRSVPQKYVSKFKKSAEKVEDTILNTIILGKLNKFSEQNYPEIKEFITHIIDSGQTDMIKCFMKLVFEKAASEEMFCPLYAKLLSELSARYPVLLTEMTNLYSEYMEIFEEVVETSAENYNEVCKRNIGKKYRRGYSQFLAELIKHDVIDADTFTKTVTKIITQIEGNIKNKEATKLTEEYSDCLQKIMKAIKTNSDRYDTDSNDENNEKKVEAIRMTLKGDTSARIHPLTVRNSDNTGLSNKARFTLLDIYEAIQKF